MKSKNYHFGDLKAALIKETLKQLSKNDYRKISFRMIAKNLGVAASAPYNHFKNKDQLFQEIIRNGKKKLIDLMKNEKKKSNIPSQQLSLVAKCYLSFARQEKQLFDLMFDRMNKELLNLTNEVIFQFKDIVREKLSESKRFRISEDGAAITAWSMIHGLAYAINLTDLESFEDKVNMKLNKVFMEMSSIWAKGVTNN